MLAKEALESTDPEVPDVPEVPNIIKTGRLAVEGNIASAVSSIKALAKDAATEDFNHDLINRTEALLAHEKLVADMKLVTSLHELYCVYRKRGRSEDSEEELITKDEKYISELELKAHRAMDVHIEYEKSFARNKKTRADQIRMEI